MQAQKSLGDKAILRIPAEKINWRFNPESNSMAVLICHLSGNMLSRWTHFLTTDGEKDGRNRDHEFEEQYYNKTEWIQIWEKGWTCLFTALGELKPEDLTKTVYIRKEPMTVTVAIIRQLAHYSYHIGQMVFLTKMICGEDWVSLSIPRGESESYNLTKEEEARSKHI